MECHNRLTIRISYCKRSTHGLWKEPDFPQSPVSIVLLFFLTRIIYPDSAANQSTPAAPTPTAPATVVSVIKESVPTGKGPVLNSRQSSQLCSLVGPTCPPTRPSPAPPASNFKLCTFIGVVLSISLTTKAEDICSRKCSCNRARPSGAS